ncbi:hypothetical protein AGRA3207_007383 [Actinomadura graeca]|uniref:Uncharacterized protein n=1 Tax=Actinomadura graeca TaxID=2750812 RepID=A0ABX8R5M2_9ACTN|nr:hypothetical protein [Actinomadura graeca]QXJ25826.1 hypothetical protein AGRA3207_007383 [Actinomadura graeca]
MTSPPDDDEPDEDATSREESDFYFQRILGLINQYELRLEELDRSLLPPTDELRAVGIFGLRDLDAGYEELFTWGPPEDDFRHIDSLKAVNDRLHEIYNRLGPPPGWSPDD